MNHSNSIKTTFMIETDAPLKCCGARREGCIYPYHPRLRANLYHPTIGQIYSDPPLGKSISLRPWANQYHPVLGQSHIFRPWANPYYPSLDKSISPALWQIHITRPANNATSTHSIKYIIFLPIRRLLFNNRYHGYQ